MSDPDFERLEAVGDELEQLLDGGWLTRDAFDRLPTDATDAAAGHGELLEFLLIHAQPGWLDAA